MANDHVDPLSFQMDQPHSYRLVFEPDTESTAVEKALTWARSVRYKSAPGRAAGPAFDVTVDNPGTRWAAVFSVLGRLKQGGMSAQDFLPLDVATEADHEWLDEALTMWTRHGNRQAGRRRLESCSGASIMETFRSWIGDKGQDAAFAMSLTAFNTPGPDTFLALIEEAYAQCGRGRSGRKPADTLLDHGAGNVARLCSQLGRHQNTSFPEGPLPELITSEWWDVRMSALTALAHSPGTLTASTVEILCELIRKGINEADHAAAALAKAEPTPGLQTFLSEVFFANTGDLRRRAAQTYCALWPEEGQAVWTELLTKSHIFDRSLGHGLLVRYGTAGDVPTAAAELRRIIRTKRKRKAVPPFGSELVSFLIRHQDHPDAQAGLEHIGSHWESIEDDFQTWITEQHPEVADT